jgi:hypothetical protein
MRRIGGDIPTADPVFCEVRIEEKPFHVLFNDG